MKKIGRPPSFKASMRDRIIQLYKQPGATDKSVAKALGVSERTLYNWKGSNKDFMQLLQSIEAAKSIPDMLVEAALFSRATGYSCPETKVYFDKYGDSYTRTIQRHYPPDVHACLRWLENRQPKKWRRAPQVIVMPPEPSKNGQITPKKKTYEEFCETASYPKPLSKQLEMREFAFGNVEPRLLLGARGTGKTDYITVMGEAYEVYLDWFAFKYEGQERLTETCLIITKSKERNAAMLTEIANALLANGVPLEKNTATAVRVEGLIGKDNTVSAVTIKTVSLRGRHPKRVILDDPVTEDDTGEATRKLAEKKYNEVMKLVTNVLVIGQPAHKFDLYAKLRGIIKKMEVPHGSIPELDHDLEAQRAAGVDESSIQASYFLKIMAEGATPFDNINYIDQLPAGGTSFAFIDPAKEGKDTTAVTIFKQYGQGIAVEGYVWRKSWNHCLDDMVPILKARGVQRVAFETNGVGEQPLGVLRAVFAEAGLMAGVIGRFSVTEKHSTIMMAGAFAHMIHLSKQSSPKYIEQVIQYEYGVKVDDGPDSLARGLECLNIIKGKGPKRG